MDPEEFKARTKQFGLRIVRLVESLPNRMVPATLGKQLLRAGTSVGANYRSACRAKSPADFISKMETVEEECDESLYWMEQLIDAGYLKASRVSGLMQEGSEILAMVVASARTARRGNATSRKTRVQSAIRNSQSAIP